MLRVNRILCNILATALEFATASSDFVKLATSTASNVASVTFDGYFSSTYYAYYLQCINVIPATDAVGLRFYFRNAGSDLTGTDYWGTGFRVRSGTANEDSGTNANQAYDNQGYMANWNETSNTTTNNGICLNATFFNPLDTSNMKWILRDSVQITTSGALRHMREIGLSEYKGTTVDGFKIFFSSGNITSGRFALYGIKY